YLLFIKSLKIENEKRTLIHFVFLFGIGEKPYFSAIGEYCKLSI
ncbi:MAG: hypothetical protein RIR62_2941, partial [Pseudomonadota bacterium]